MRPLFLSSASDSDDDAVTSHRPSDSVSATLADSDSSGCESDDSASLPYIVDVAAVSASLARSMCDKGVQQTEAARRVMLAESGGETKQAVDESGCADEADEEAASEAADDTNHSFAPDCSTPPAASPRLSTPHTVSAWTAVAPLPPLTLPLPRPATSSASTRGGITCRQAVLRPNTATARTPRPATASTSAAPSTSASVSSSSHSLSPRSQSSFRSGSPSPPRSLASLQLPVDCVGVSDLTGSQHSILRGNFLSAARERRRQSKLQQQLQCESVVRVKSGERVGTASGCEERVGFVGPRVVDVSRASTAPSSASASSLFDSLSIPSSPESFRISPRSPASPVFYTGMQPRLPALSACVFPIQAADQK